MTSNNLFFSVSKFFNDDKVDGDTTEAAYLRNRTVLDYYESLNTLDSQNTCTLLSLNLESYNKFWEKKSQFYEAEIEKKLLTPEVTKNCKQWETSLQSIIKETPRQASNCNNEIKTEDLNAFISMFSDKSTLEVETKSREKTIAKRFAPGCCTKEPKRLCKANSADTLQTQPENNIGTKSIFKTAKEELDLQNRKKFGRSNSGVNSYSQVNSNVGQKKTLGMRGGVASKFVSPLATNNSNEEESEKDERLKNIEPKMVELIKSEIMNINTIVNWSDIAGLEFAKTSIQEAVVWPLLRPDIFTGLRKPPKGILLFGPPGTGKTLIGKCIASQSNSTFFSISASSLASKWIGDGEKLVRALFAVARCHQPAVIFIDEVDSLLCKRSETEHESSRRLKTEFLVQLDGATTDSDDRILLVGATNRPQELDEAARRRFVKRLYIPLPEYQARLQLITKLMAEQQNNLSTADMEEVARLSDGYSGADVKNLCCEACFGPIRSLDMSRIKSIEANEIRPVGMEDFKNAFGRVRSSVSPKDLDQYVVWDNTYGSGSV